MAFGAQMQDRAAEESELHADLHQHRQITEGEGLEGGDRGPDIAAPAVPLREAHAGLPRRRHLDHEFAHPLAVRVGAEPVGLLQDGGVRHQVGTDQVPDLGVLAVEHLGQGPDVELRLHVPVGSGNCFVSGHTLSLPRPGAITR
ncbi:hypothetical protein SMICM304S_06947 [Streptomyces microflavus]